MTGGQLRSFRLGNRSELLVQHLLAGIAFTTPVPRTEDIGVDFLCSLIAKTSDKGLLKAGPFFTVQAKSKGVDQLIYEKQHELDWISEQENPMLICVADRDTTSMDVYSTWNLSCGILAGHRGTKAAVRIVLRPNQTSEDWPHIRDLDDGTQEILLGVPIAHVTHEDIVDEARTKELVAVLAAWIVFDRVNIVNRRAGLHYVVAPLSYQTNKMLEPNAILGVAGYWNPQNLEQCKRNLVLSAVSLWRTLAPTGLTSVAAPWAEGVPLLRELLRWCCTIDPTVKGFVRDLDSRS